MSTSTETLLEMTDRVIARNIPEPCENYVSEGYDPIGVNRQKCGRMTTIWSIAGEMPMCERCMEEYL